MPPLAFVALALALSAGSAALSYAQLRRVTRAASADLPALAASLRRLPPERRAGELARRAPAGTWEHRLATELLDAPSAPARLAAVNDALAEMELALAERAAWPRAAVRICAFGAMLLAVTAFLVRRSGEHLLLLLAIGAAGAVASAIAGHTAERAARGLREAIDALVAALLDAPRSAPKGPLPTPRRRRSAT